MTVVREVSNHSGVLLVAGTTLTENILRRLPDWGVDTLDVTEESMGSGSTPSAPVFPPELVRDAQELVNHLHKHVTFTSPTVIRLRELAVRRTAARLSKDAKHRAPSSSAEPTSTRAEGAAGTPPVAGPGPVLEMHHEDRPLDRPL